MKLISASLNHYYRLMQNKHPNVLWFGDESHREISITFDDGPHPKDTPEVLEMLAKHHIHATFFLVGMYAEQYPELVKQIHQNGHQLGIHCYRHHPFPLEDPQILRTQLDHTRNLIANTCGISLETICDLRPPYGTFTPKIASLLADWDYRLVMWNNIPPHWMQPVSWTISQIFDQIIPSSIIVLHDGHGHGTKVAQILDIIIPKLKAQGYDFVTIAQMREWKR
jgi:peptidoglycan/xylan/chitin deacetylase (PgdA/CDA1 family)